MVAGPSAIPGNQQKAIFTLCDVDIVVGDMVHVMSDLLETMKSGTLARSSS